MSSDQLVWNTSTEILQNWCSGLGYSLEEIAPCVISRDGDLWSINMANGFFPKLPKHYSSVVYSTPAPLPPSGGPGTELSKLLKRFGIEPTPTCSCRAKAAQMDAWGCDECSKPERIEEVVGVMRKEAQARGLPFLDAAARLLVKRAISNARKAEAKRGRETEGSSLHTER